VDVEVFDGAEVVLVRRLVERDAAVGEDELDSLDERLARVVVERHRHAQQVRDAPLHHITRPHTPTAVTHGHGALQSRCIIYEGLVFTARRSYASAILGVVILSVCLFVCHTRAFERTYRRFFYTT